MTKGPSPLLGYNTNVRHRGRVFHIQTEDSGTTHPHVITHLFADGGRILKSNKTGYAELVAALDMAVQVKKIMQDQHKAMFIALRDGQFDHLFENAPAESSTPHGNPAEESGFAEIRKSQAVPSVPVSVAQPTPAPVVAPVAAPAVPKPSVSLPTPAATSVDKLQRTSSVAMPAIRPPSIPAEPRPSTPPRPTGSTPSQRPTGMSGHYQSVRSPEILGSFKSRDSVAGAPANIFGDGLMSEKSLDEVILAYLSEDLDDDKS